MQAVRMAATPRMAGDGFGAGGKERPEEAPLPPCGKPAVDSGVQRTAW